MRERGVDAAMIRTLSSFTYFTDVKWLRPALLIPAEGKPVAFIFLSEEKEFSGKSCVKDIVTYRGVDELIGEVSGAIRKNGYTTVGFDVSIERDAYELFYHMFKSFTPQAHIIDVHSDIMSLRMIKDRDEIDAISRATEISDTGMLAAHNALKPGASELDIASEACYAMMRSGAEAPHVYVNAGPHPRLHAEPRRDNLIKNDSVVAVTVAGDYNNYYGNESRTFLMAGASEKKRGAIKAGMEMYHAAVANLKPGNVFNDVESVIGRSIEETEFSPGYVKGFSHGVGLLVEEDPITTILIPERRTVIAENMVLAAVHAPLALPGIGAIKTEDTFLVVGEGVRRLTGFELDP